VGIIFETLKYRGVESFEICAETARHRSIGNHIAQTKEHNLKAILHIATLLVATTLSLNQKVEKTLVEQLLLIAKEFV
jgi:hypothetical protein